MAMMRWLKKSMVLGFLVVGGLASTTSTAFAEDSKSAEEIMEAAVERNALGFEQGRAQVTLTVFDREGEKQERLLDVRSRRDEERTRTIMSLTDPAEVRGQSFLFVENPDADDDMWMYVPAFEVTRRVEGRQRQSSFLGTHFTFADLESRDLREAGYERQADEKIGDYDVHVIEATPNESEDSNYKRVVAYIRHGDHVPIRIRYYDRDGDLDKTLYTERLQTTEDDETYIERMTLRSESGGYTTIEITGLDTDIELPSSIFDRDELGR